jgi:hypothetical protein
MFERFVQDVTSGGFWVVIGIEFCQDDSGQPCMAQSKRLPDFNATPAFDKQTSVPFEMKYQLVKYGLGTQCRVDSQTFTIANTVENDRLPEEHVATWLCDKLDLFDGLAMSKSQGPGHTPLFVTVETSSGQILSMKQQEEKTAQVSSSLFEMGFWSLLASTPSTSEQICCPQTFDRDEFVNGTPLPGRARRKLLRVKSHHPQRCGAPRRWDAVLTGSMAGDELSRGFLRVADAKTGVTTHHQRQT